MKDALKSIDKKTLKIAALGLVGIVFLIVLISLLVKFTSKNYNTYEEVEDKLVEAAKNYYTDNKFYLPTVEGGSSTVTMNSLVVGSYISPLEELLENGISCTAEVVVTKLSNNYDYIPYLNCGDEYNTIELVKKVLEDNKIVTEGVGLYSIDNTKVFRGEVKNNFVMLNDKLWRIIRIDENNNLVLMSHFKTVSFVWDNRYNEETKATYGISNYNLSRIKERIENEYYNGDLLTSGEKAKVVLKKWCLGSRKYTDNGNMNSVECLEFTEDESPIGLLTVFEYIQASIDPNCRTLEDRGCTNYNYMHDMQSTFWTITKGQKSSSYIYNITSSGVTESRANATKQVRYIINLGPKAIYSSGSGIETDPYILK